MSWQYVFRLVKRWTEVEYLVQDSLRNNRIFPFSRSSRRSFAAQYEPADGR